MCGTQKGEARDGARGGPKEESKALHYCRTLRSRRARVCIVRPTNRKPSRRGTWFVEGHVNLTSALPFERCDWPSGQNAPGGSIPRHSPFNNACSSAPNPRPSIYSVSPSIHLRERVGDGGGRDHCHGLGGPRETCRGVNANMQVSGEACCLTTYLHAGNASSARYQDRQGRLDQARTQAVCRAVRGH